MDKRVLRERMRRKQKQIRRRRMMKRITCEVAAILLLVFVVRGVILPIVNHAGGGSKTLLSIFYIPVYILISFFDI